MSTTAATLASSPVFRRSGEALASISYVARLAVTTMTAGSAHGWRATYADGAVRPRAPCALRPALVAAVSMPCGQACGPGPPLAG